MKVELDLRLNIFHRFLVMQTKSSFLGQVLLSKDSEDLTKHCTSRTYQIKTFWPNSTFL